MIFSNHIIFNFTEYFRTRHRQSSLAPIVVDLGFRTIFTSQVISVACYIEREKSNKVCSEALISAWCSLTSHNSTTRDPRFYFPPKGRHTEDFYALKKFIDPGRVCTCELRIQCRDAGPGGSRRRGRAWLYSLGLKDCGFESRLGHGCLCSSLCV